jgi:transcriptional regulator with XRE-family HTH domain
MELPEQFAAPAALSRRAERSFTPNRIAELRRASGLTLSQLATKAGTTSATISKLERSEIKLSVEWMDKLAPLLRVKPADLVWPEDVPNDQKNPSTPTTGTISGRVNLSFVLSGHYELEDYNRASGMMRKIVEEGMGRVDLGEEMREEKQRTVDLIVLIFALIFLEIKGSSGLLDESQIKASRSAFNAFMRSLGVA